jgi:hypothetical protein
VKRFLAFAALMAGVFLSLPASAAPAPPPAATASAVAQPGQPLCSLEEWTMRPLDECIARLSELNPERAVCVHAPNPATPDSGFAGWFATQPTWQTGPAQSGLLYSEYGYAGYDYTTYDIGCADTLMHPDHKIESTIANGEFMIATGIVAASNGLREKAWDPGNLWSWADPLVNGATRAIYDRVFSVFGMITLAVVGMYLLWRSRQAQMSAALTTAGWALLVLIAVTALAKWPVQSANVADGALTGTLTVVHDAIGPRSDNIPNCDDPATPGACIDQRPSAVRAGDTAVATLLYRNWLRGVLGSADSDTAKKYGPALYRAKSLSWTDMEAIESNPARRQPLIDSKQNDWKKVAEQIRTEDPEAYEYLRGTKGMERVGAGFVAILAALAYASFDIVASLLVLLGFVIIRWAIIAAPALGTVGLLRPASAGIRRLINSVVAAAINVAIFGVGAAVYLLAVDLIMSTASLPGWLQVTLVLLCGAVGWMLLRPYTRITQLSGRSGGAALLTARPTTAAATTTTNVDVTTGGVKPEGRVEHEVNVETTSVPRAEARPGSDGSTPPAPRKQNWTDPGTYDPEPAYAIYRPATVPQQVSNGADDAKPVQPRSEARTETR